MRKHPFDTAGFLFTLIAGTLLHFVYEWSGFNYFVGFFAPVNESVWEHLKLLVIPAVLWCLGRFLIHMYDYTTYLPAVSLGIISGALSIIVIFYTYSGIIGTSYVVFDVLIFIFSIFLVFYIIKRTADMGSFPTPTVISSLIVLVLLLVCIVLFTIYPPKLGLFTPL